MTFDAAATRAIAPDVRIGRDARIAPFVNLYGCSIGDETKIGPFVEIQKNAAIGARCKVSSHTFICEGVTVEDECFIGHHVCFTNDPYPRATADGGTANRRRLDRGAHAGQARGFDRQRRRDPLRHDDRRRGHRRRRRGGDQGRGAV